MTASSPRTAERPLLHEVREHVGEVGSSAEPEEVVERFGFRQTEVHGSQILVNGGPVKLRAHVPPRSSGTIDLDPGRAVLAGEILALELRHPDGRLVDAYRLSIGEERPRSTVHLRLCRMPAR